MGNKLRIRSRKFPAIVNCTAINWFHEWPQEALESVSLRFLQNTKNIQVREDRVPPRVHLTSGIQGSRLKLEVEGWIEPWSITFYVVKGWMIMFNLIISGVSLP